MLTAERHHAILRLLAEQGRITVAQIARHFGISTATARRDAVLLTEAGKAARSHGGLLPASFFRDSTGGPAARPADGPTRIAVRAGELLPHEGNVFVDAGELCLAVGRVLMARADLRIFTNSIPLIALAAESSATLTGIGGEAQKHALAGDLARSWLTQLRFDAAVIGAQGLDPVSGAYAADAQLATIKAEVLRRSATRLLVARADSWNRPAGVRFAPWNAFTSLVTDADPAPQARVALGADKVALYLV